MIFIRGASEIFKLILAKLFKLSLWNNSMLKRKRIREKGKFSFTRFFQRFNSGDSVAIVRELSLQSPGFPKRMQGRTGKIIEKRGSAYVVEIKDHNMPKIYNIKPIHLKKIEEKQ